MFHRTSSATVSHQGSLSVQAGKHKFCAPHHEIEIRLRWNYWSLECTIISFTNQFGMSDLMIKKIRAGRRSSTVMASAVSGKAKKCKQIWNQVNQHRWTCKLLLHFIGFCSMKRLGVFLLPCGWDVSPLQGYPQHYIRRYPFIHLGGEGLAQEHNIMSPAWARTRTSRSGSECTNHETTPPRLVRVNCYISQTVIGQFSRLHSLVLEVVLDVV